MLKDEILKHLKQSVLFELADDSVLQKVSEIVIQKSINAGENLITKGELGDSMYILCSGKVKVHDGDLVLNYLSRGNVFGEMAALDGEVRTASITAVEESDLMQLNRDDLSELCRKEPEVGRALIHFLCQRGKNIISDITTRSLKLKTLEKEFEIGRNIQAGFLPESLPEIDGWDIAAYFQAAREVAGDFYDLFEIEHHGKLGVVVGDVCGKGVGAALFMALFRSLIRATMLSFDFINETEDKRDDISSTDIARILQNTITITNNYVAKTHGSTCMFATLFIAILDPDTGRLNYINAGHEPPVIFNSDGVKRVMSNTGPAAGLFSGTTFETGEAYIEKGDAMLAFTDGVTEAVNPENEQFSTERLLDMVIKNRNSSSESLNEVVCELRKFTNDVEQFDDITLLEIKRS
jgi:serine phosphatase RsbU (regulator of sigma subunit)